MRKEKTDKSRKIKNIEKKAIMREKMDNKTLKLKAKAINPIVRVGKTGLSKSIIAEIIKQAKHHKLIKIKLLKASFAEIPKKELITRIVKETGTELILTQGNMVSIYKK